MTALDVNPLAKPSSLLNYGLYRGAYSGTFLWIIDNKRVIDAHMKVSAYTISPLEYIHINDTVGIIVDSNHIQIKNDLLEFCAPALPEHGTTFACGYYKFTFKQGSVVYQNDQSTTEIPTSTRVTGDGVPMIILQNDSSVSYRTIYCFGTACVASYSPDGNRVNGNLFKKKNNQ